MFRSIIAATAAVAACAPANAETWEVMNRVITAPRPNAGTFEYLSSTVNVDSLTNLGTFRLTLTGDRAPDSFTLQTGSRQLWSVCCSITVPHYRFSRAGGALTYTPTGFEFVYTHVWAWMSSTEWNIRSGQ